MRHSASLAALLLAEEGGEEEEEGEEEDREEEEVEVEQTRATAALSGQPSPPSFADELQQHTELKVIFQPCLLSLQSTTH